MTQPILPIPSRPPAGWYQSELDGQDRWWDGSQWTQAYRPTPQPVGYIPIAGQAAQHPVQQYGGGSLIGTDQNTSTPEVVIAWILTVLTFFYLLPWAIAASRGKSNSLAVGLINFLLGWTVIGWIVSLVMACGAHQQRMAVVQMVNVPHYYPPQR